MIVPVFYTSLSGNTEEAAHLVAEAVGGTPVDVAGDPAALEAALSALAAGEAPVAFFGTYTWGDGELPEAMRRFLRRLLIDEADRYRPLPPAAVFGTGDSIFPRFCRAVDAVRYHLERRGVRVVAEGMKLEQSPHGLGQAPKLVAWARDAYRAATGRLPAPARPVRA